MAKRRKRRKVDAAGLDFVAFGRVVGVTGPAVMRAADAGRLDGCLGIGKRGRVVVDVPRAVRQWAASHHRPRNLSQGEAQALGKPTKGGKPRGTPRSGVFGSKSNAKGSNTPESVTGPAHELGNVVPASTLVEVQRRVGLHRERELAIKNDLAEGRVVKVEDVAREAFEASRIIREALLNLPVQVAGDVLGLRDLRGVIAVLDRAVRSALNVTADALAEGAKA